MGPEVSGGTTFSVIFSGGRARRRRKISRLLAAERLIPFKEGTFRIPELGKIRTKFTDDLEIALSCRLDFSTATERILF